MTIQKFLSALSLNNTITQIGTVNVVECIEGKDNVESYIAKSTEKNIYFLANVNSNKQYERANDDDIKFKRYVYFDFDIRKQKEDATDEQIKEMGVCFGEILDNTEFNDWSYIIFTGNGVHIYFIGEPQEIDKNNYSKGYEIISKKLESILEFKPDKTCKNVARIARLPLSYNNKKEKKLVEILVEKDKTSNLIEKMQEIGIKEIQMSNEIEKEEIVLREIQKHKNLYSSEKIIEHIDLIPIEQEVQKDYPAWTFDGKNFHDNNGIAAAFVSQKIKNVLIPSDSRWFVDIKYTGVGTFLYRREMSKLSNKETIGYFVREYPQLENFTKKQIDCSKFEPLNFEKLAEILGLTIKKDVENKIVTFLCELSAFTEYSQFNISFNAPSSTGKSYIPTEIAQLFPKEDVIEIGYCSPTAFFHDVGEFNKERKGYEIDLSRKILIFLDQPHTQLLERLRPLLSHDKKEMHLKVTDKSQKAGLRTKNVFIKGFPAVIFCSAGMKIDEQESTRFFLLSPEINQEKLREGIREQIQKASDNQAYITWLESKPERITLKDRIEAIRNEKIIEVKIDKPELIEEIFLGKKRILKPRHQRDIGRLISLIKVRALLNLWFRKREGNTIIANEEDIKETAEIWEKISESQEYNLSPYLYNLYQDVIVPAWKEKNENEENPNKLGLTRQEVIKKHYQVYERMIENFRLRQEILPMLEASGLITQEPDANDRRKMLIYPTPVLTISKKEKQ